MELYVLYDEIDRLLTEKGIKTHKAYVGNYFTSLDMMGATLTVMKLDDELKELDRQAGIFHGSEAGIGGVRHMGTFKNEAGKPILMRMVKGIQENKAYLGDVDGLIGDGDHGMNMNKGFSVFEERFKDEDISFTEGLDELGMILLNEIGGSMGPIYGTIFMDMAEAGEDLEEISAADLADMLEAGLNGLYGIVDARVGDKTLVDTLAPSVDVLKKAGETGQDFKEALEEMKAAALAGRDSTKDMVAKYGRSSRLGERSRGVLDAGATSCCIILTAMADGIIDLL